MRVDNFEVQVRPAQTNEFYQEFSTTKRGYYAAAYSSHGRAKGCYIAPNPGTGFDVTWKFHGGRPTSWGSGMIWSASRYAITVDIDGKRATECSWNTPFQCDLLETDWSAIPQREPTRCYARMVFGNHDSYTLPRIQSGDYHDTIPTSGTGSLVVTFSPFKSSNEPSKSAGILRFVFLYRSFGMLERLDLLSLENPVPAVEHEELAQDDEGEGEEIHPEEQEKEEDAEEEDEGCRAEDLQVVPYVDTRANRPAQKEQRSSSGQCDKGSKGDDRSFRKALDDRLSKLNADRSSMRSERDILQGVLDGLCDTASYLPGEGKGEDETFTSALQARIKKLNHTREAMAGQYDKIKALRDEASRPQGKENSGQAKRKAGTAENASSKRQKA